MLADSLAVLRKAQKEWYAVPALNVQNLETVLAVLQAAEDSRSPVFVQTSAGAISYAGLDNLLAMITVAAEQVSVPVVLHLDHGKELSLVEQAIKAGYCSVMYDGSSLPYQQNVKNTKKIVSLAHRHGIAVEAELGTIRGMEDFVSADDYLTDPHQAREFVKATGCDSLAVAIGTAHGAYKFKGKPKLDFKRLERIAQVVKIPLVLHGASGVRRSDVTLAERWGAKLGNAQGVPDSAIRKAIKLGVAKINIDSDLRLAFMTGLRKALQKNPSSLDPREALGEAKQLTYETAKKKIKLFGSVGKGK
ncbi:MAG: class II fructose-1,6-bisphosphate aldolase [bacterium]